MARFAGKVALVTGGARGIGEAVVRLLVDEGAEVVVADVLDDEGRALAEETGSAYVHLDVSDPDGWRAALDGRAVDLGVLNAGIGARYDDLLDVPDGVFEQVIAVNATGVYLGTRELLRVMRGRGGAISVTASIAGLVAHTQSPIYAASKWAALGWVRSVAPSLLADGVRINAVCPGLVDTPILGPGGGDRMRAMGLAVLDPGDVAQAHADLLAGDASGEVVTVQHGRGVLRHEPAEVAGYQG
ncbi:MAG: SDR family NAD(P)-dependent oxidoreductase [Candidatus Nanopelagicales bacterium]